MDRRRGLLALLVVGLVTAACGEQAPSASPSAAIVAVTSPVPSQSLSATPGVSTNPSPSTTARPTATALPTPTPMPTPTPTPTPWKAYTSKRYHYKVRYPPNWIVTPGSGGYTDQFDAYDYPYVYISRDTVGGIASVSITVTRNVAYFKSHYKAKVISNKPIKLAGWSGRIVTLRGKDQGQTILIQHILVAKGRVGYTIEMWGDDGRAASDRALFKQIYGTWRAT